VYRPRGFLFRCLTLTCLDVVYIVNEKLPLLKLALAWNSIDFAKDEILTDNDCWEVSCLFCRIASYSKAP